MLPLAFCCPTQVVRLLLENRADVHARNNNGYVHKTLDEPVSGKQMGWRSYVDRYHCFSPCSTRQVLGPPVHPLLSASGCCFHWKKPRHVLQVWVTSDTSLVAPPAVRSTPLLAAVANRHRDVVEELLSRSADANAKDVDGITPLMHACRNGDTQLVLELVTRGAVVDATTPSGSSGLLCAVSEGHYEVFKALLDEGAAFKPIAALQHLLKATRLSPDGHWRIARHALLAQATGGRGGQQLTADEKAGVLGFLRRGVRDGQVELVRDVLAKDTSTALLGREQVSEGEGMGRGGGADVDWV